MNRFLDRNIRVPLEIVENKRLTANEKLFYAILLDSIVGNEIAVINRDISKKEIYMLKRLKNQKAIESFTVQEGFTTVKFDLKGFVTDDKTYLWTKRTYPK